MEIENKPQALQRTLAGERKAPVASNAVVAEKILTVIRRVEEKLQRPVYFIEIYREALKYANETGETLLIRSQDLQNIFRDDLVLGDAELNLYSLDAKNQRSWPNNPNGMELCSDRMQRLYPSYKLDERGRFLPGDET